MRSGHVAIVGLVWLAAAIGASASGFVATLRPPVPQFVIVALTGALILAGVFVTPFRRWVMAIDLRVAVALHLTRFVGAYFLFLYDRGELPYAFAVPGGVGDILVATLALVLLLTVRPVGTRGRLYFAWNVLGALDILGVVVTAASAALADPSSMAPLLRLPLSLLVTFLVPLIIASHVLVAVRLLRRAQPEPGA